MSEPARSQRYAGEVAGREASDLALARAFGRGRDAGAIDPTTLASSILVLQPSRQQLAQTGGDLIRWGDSRPESDRATWICSSVLPIVPFGAGYYIDDFFGTEYMETADTCEQIGLKPSQAFSLLIVVRRDAGAPAEPTHLLDAADPAGALRLATEGGSVVCHVNGTAVLSLPQPPVATWATIELINDGTTLTMVSADGSVSCPTPTWDHTLRPVLGFGPLSVSGGSAWAGDVGLFMTASHVDGATLRGVRAWLPSIFGSSIRLPWAG